MQEVSIIMAMFYTKANISNYDGNARYLDIKSNCDDGNVRYLDNKSNFDGNAWYLDNISN